MRLRGLKASRALRGAIAMAVLATALVLSACSSSTGARTVEGEISSVDDSTITVTTSDGQTDTFLINDDTEITMSQDGLSQGDMAQNDMGQGGGQAGAAQGDSQASGDNGADESEPPAKPDGENANATGEGSSNSGDGNEPPAKPDGENASASTGTDDDASTNSGASSSQGTQPPDLPDGENGTGEGQAPSDAGQAPSDAGQAPSDMSQGTPSLAAGMTVTAEVGSDNVATSVTITSMGSMGQGGGMGVDQTSIDYKSAYTYTEDTIVEGETLESTGTDENVVLVDSDISVTLKNDQIIRTSSDSTGGDNSSFYGVGAALLATKGTLTVEDSTITTDAQGGAGVFAYGDGVVEVSNTTITTKQDTSGGIHVAGGGTLHAVNVTAETNGESSAAIRSDRGSGTMTVEGGSFTSNGTGSPAIYSTADITVSNAALKATNSEAICIEGLNSIRLTDCTLEGNQPEDARNEIAWNVILYQSMSGDSEEGNATFTMNGGSLTAHNGGMFYTTNTESTFVLKNVDITYAENNPFLLRCTGNSNQRGWGSAGSNGAECNFTAIQQQLEGDVQWDSISELDMYLTASSQLTGAFVQDETTAGSGGNGFANLYIGEGCTWVVTSNSTLTNLANAGTILDEQGNTVTVQDASGSVLVQGTSAYTVTVSSYSTTPDMSGAQSLDK